MTFYTGDAQLDAWITEFIALDPQLTDWNGNTRQLSSMSFDRECDGPGSQPSTGFCAAAHSAFSAFIRERKEDPYDGTISYTQACVMADHGYTDAPYLQHIQHMDELDDGRLSDRHISTLYKAEDGHQYMIDFTATQYGYEQWPLVQRRIEGIMALPPWYDRMNLFDRAREYAPPLWERVLGPGLAKCAVQRAESFSLFDHPLPAPASPISPLGNDSLDP